MGLRGFFGLRFRIQGFRGSEVSGFRSFRGLGFGVFRVWVLGCRVQV